MPARLVALLAAITACLFALPTASAAPLGTAHTTAHTTARTTAASSQDVPCIDQTPAPGADFQPLHVCASFDKSSYRSSDRVAITVTITNEGTATATGIWMLGFSSKSLYLPNEWTGLANVEVGDRPGASLPAGATATIMTWGWSADPASGSVEFVGAPVQQDSAGNEGPSSANLDITAPVTPVTGNYGGLVYTTTDINDVPAPEAGLPGVAVTMTSIPSGTTYQATTDSQGRFLFTNLPGGPYGIDFTAPRDWIIRQHDVGEIVVTDSGVEYDPNYHAVRPESSILQAAMSFDASSYPVGATATLTVKLTNLTAKTMAGVHDRCNISGDGGELNGTGPGWSPLDDPAGTTLPPGTTTFHVSETVPQVPVYVGYPPTLYTGCAFGNDVDFEGEPYVSTTALVTGESTTTPSHVAARPIVSTKAAAATTAANCADDTKLIMCAWFDKPAYRSSDTIHATLVITNETTAPITGLWLAKAGGNFEPYTEWQGNQDINSSAVGASLAPGASMTVTTTGYDSDHTSSALEFAEVLEQNGVGPHGTVDVSLPMTQVSGGYHGWVYTLTDTNDMPAPETGLPDVVVTATSAESAGDAYQTNTDAAGRFAFTDLPGGRYTLTFLAPNGYQVAQQTITVDDSGTELAPSFLATQPESKILAATMTFDQATYHVGDTAHLTITLTNTGGRILTGVHDHCDLSGEPGQLFGTGAGWNPLANSAAVVPVGTSTFHVSEPVTWTLNGQIMADCFFGNEPTFDGEPRVTATAGT